MQRKVSLFPATTVSLAQLLHIVLTLPLRFPLCGCQSSERDVEVSESAPTPRQRPAGPGQKAQGE